MAHEKCLVAAQVQSARADRERRCAASLWQARGGRIAPDLAARRRRRRRRRAAQKFTAQQVPVSVHGRRVHRPGGIPTRDASLGPDTLSLATLSAARHRHNPARHARPRCAHRTSKGSVYERVDGWAGLWVGLLKQEAGHGERGPWRVVKVSEGYWRWFLRSKRWIPDAKIFGFAGRSHETQK